jgi:hypothetical protein
MTMTSAQRKNDRWCSRPQDPLSGPSTASMIPVPRTATVVKMTNGPVTRCSGAGGPFARKPPNRCNTW